MTPLAMPMAITSWDENRGCHVLSHPAKFSFAEHINENIINQKKEND
jgi:hypothetical protein